MIVLRKLLYKKLINISRSVRLYCVKSEVDRPLKTTSGFKTGIWLYDSSLKRKTELISKENNIISWYCCGPTVYDSAHIGHACSYINFDLIRRLMEKMFNKNVIYVMGITDIDDKIIQKAKEENVDFRTISQRYEKEFFCDLDRLNVKRPTTTARVSDHIEVIIQFIQKIIDKGYGYVSSDGSVYFSVNKYERYGIFVGINEDFDQENEERGKEYSRDFALWKASKPGEPSWLSPWGEGRPGWHIECSAMASKLLGSHLDIHSGGVDLKFPHHENEEAQCCVYHNSDKWVSHWIHSGHVQLKNSIKMSKSLKNTVSIDQFLSAYSADHLRMLCLMVPYRNGIEYGDDVVDGAISLCNKFKNFIDDCNAYIKGTKPLGSFDEYAILQDLDKTQEIVRKCLADDFDTATAIFQIKQFITRANTSFNQAEIGSVTKSYFAVIAARSYVNSFLSICGFNVGDSRGMEVNASNESDLINVMEASLQLRSEVRETALLKHLNTPDLLVIKKNLLTACDHFRDTLNLCGIELKDFGKKTSWSTNQAVKRTKKF